MQKFKRKIICSTKIFQKIVPEKYFSSLQEDAEIKIDLRQPNHRELKGNERFALVNHNLLLNYFSDLNNILIPKRLEDFQRGNESQYEYLRTETKNMLAQQKIEIGDMLQMTKFVSLLSRDQELIQALINSFLQRIEKFELSNLIEISWYLCHLNNEESKGSIFKEVAKGFRQNLNPNFIRNFSMAYKMMMTQIIYETNSLYSGKDFLFLQQAHLPENLELISIDDFKISFYEEIADNLRQRGIEIKSTNSFVNGYNIGIQLQSNYVLEFFKKWVKEEIVLNYRFLRARQLQKSGLNIIPINITSTPLNTKRISDLAIKNLPNSLKKQSSQ